MILSDRTKKLLRYCRDLIADFLFPITCLGCGRSGKYLCTGCQASIPRITEGYCPVCRHPSTRGVSCLDCSRKTSLAGVFASLSYRHPLTSRMIHAYKYRFVESLADPLGEMLVVAIRNTELPLPTFIIPVPLHITRLRWRNFNQAERIAHHIATEITPGLPIPIVTERLIRTRATLPQAKTRDRKERLQNLRNAFVWQENEHAPIALSGASIWLVDDVATTNATLEECARVLRTAGARSVYGIVVAR